MKIVDDFPPNIEYLREHFPTIDTVRPIICYGDSIYNPYGNKLTPDIIHHEEVHARQQGLDPEAYCKRYIEDLDFRLKCELEAYAEQLKFIRKTEGKLRYKGSLWKYGDILAGPFYGNLLTFDEARSKLRELTKEE